MKELCIFGLGYIGLPTACLIAAHGYRLIGVDVNKEIVDAINQWKTGEPIGNYTEAKPCEIWKILGGIVDESFVDCL